MRAGSSTRVVIVGGAIMGSFSAWALRQAGFDGKITVVEKDPTYQYSSTALSAASIRTQFGTPTNIRMSLYGAELFRDIQAVFHYVPLHSSPFGQAAGRADGPLPLTTAMSDRLVRLPLWLGLEEQLDGVIEASLAALRVAPA